MTKTYKSKGLTVTPYNHKFMVKGKEYTYTSMVIYEDEYTFYGVELCK